MNIGVTCQQVPEVWHLELTDDEMADLAYAVNLLHPGPTRFRITKQLGDGVRREARDLAGRRENEWDRLLALGTERAEIV